MGVVMLLKLLELVAGGGVAVIRGSGGGGAASAALKTRVCGWVVLVQDTYGLACCLLPGIFRVHAAPTESQMLTENFFGVKHMLTQKEHMDCICMCHDGL